MNISGNIQCAKNVNVLKIEMFIILWYVFRTGDQILEYNGTDLRHATAEEAAYELAKPADKVTVLAQYNMDRK